MAFDDYSSTCKHYRVDKMLKLEVLEEARGGREEFKNFDVAVYSKETFGMYSGEKTKVKIRLVNKMCGVFIDRFGKDIIFRPVDEEHSEIAVDVNVSPQFFGWIFSLGTGVKVTGPSEVTDEMKSFAEKFIQNYT